MRALTLKQVLFATDFSPASEAAFRYATALAERFNARLYVLHVLPEVVGAVRGTEGAEEAVKLAAQCADAMRQLRQALLAEHPDYIMASIPGDPARRILEKARQLDVDLIVLGGHHGAPAPLTRDVVQEVCESSPCPVVSVPVPSDRVRHAENHLRE